MRRDFAYCAGFWMSEESPANKCQRCKRFLSQAPAEDLWWVMPCHCYPDKCVNYIPNETPRR